MGDGSTTTRTTAGATARNARSVERATAIAHYVEAASRLLVHTFSSTIAPLAEPPPPRHPEHAMKLMGGVVETLTGFAIGAGIGAVASGVRRQFSLAVSAAVDRAIHDASGTCGAVQPGRDQQPSLVRSYLMDHDKRPLVNEFAMRLRLRLVHATHDIRSLVTAVATAIETIDPDQLGRFTSMLEVLAADDIIALRFADQLAHGWRAYRAAIAMALPPTRVTWLPAEPSSGKPPERVVLAAAGFIMQVH